MAREYIERQGQSQSLAWTVRSLDANESRKPVRDRSSSQPLQTLWSSCLPLPTVTTTHRQDIVRPREIDARSGINRALDPAYVHPPLVVPFPYPFCSREIIEKKNRGGGKKFEREKSDASVYAMPLTVAGNWWCKVWRSGRWYDFAPLPFVRYSIIERKYVRVGFCAELVDLCTRCSSTIFLVSFVTGNFWGWRRKIVEGSRRSAPI